MDLQVYRGHICGDVDFSNGELLAGTRDCVCEFVSGELILDTIVPEGLAVLLTLFTGFLAALPAGEVVAFVFVEVTLAKVVPVETDLLEGCTFVGDVIGTREGRLLTPALEVGC